MTIYQYGWLLLISLLTACSGLTKLQTEQAARFAKAGQAAPEAAASLFKQFYQLKKDVLLLQAATPANTDTILKHLHSYHDSIENNYTKTAAAYTAGYEVLSAYANALLQLADPDYAKSFAAGVPALQKNVDSLISRYNTTKDKSRHIPATLGSLLGRGIALLGTRRIQQQQKKFIRTAVNEADTAVKLICRNFISTDAAIISSRLPGLRTDVQAAFQNMANEAVLRNSAVSPLVFYKELNPLYLKLLLQLDELSNLHRLLLTAMSNFEKSHTALVTAMNNKVSRDVFIDNTKSLWSDFSSLRELYQKYQQEKADLKQLPQ